MTSRALIVPTINLRPHPPPYGELHLRKGAWDQLQARRAYDETLCETDAPARRRAELDVEI